MYLRRYLSFWTCSISFELISFFSYLNLLFYFPLQSLDPLIFSVFSFLFIYLFIFLVLFLSIIQSGLFAFRSFFYLFILLFFLHFASSRSLLFAFLDYRFLHSPSSSDFINSYLPHSFLPLLSLCISPFHPPFSIFSLLSPSFYFPHVFYLLNLFSHDAHCGNVVNHEMAKREKNFLPLFFP